MGDPAAGLLPPVVRGVGDLGEVLDALLVGGGVEVVVPGDRGNRGFSLLIGREALPHLLPQSLPS